MVDVSATLVTAPWKQSTPPTSSRSGMEYSHGGRMTNLTWYSTEKADRTFATKAELEQLRKATEGRTPDVSALATKEEVTRGDDSLSSRLYAVKATADAALPKVEAASTYATKARPWPPSGSSVSASTPPPPRRQRRPSSPRTPPAGQWLTRTPPRSLSAPT